MFPWKQNVTNENKSGYKISQNVILKATSSVQHVWETDLFSHVCFKSLVFFLVPLRAMKKGEM